MNKLTLRILASSTTAACGGFDLNETSSLELTSAASLPSQSHALCSLGSLSVGGGASIFGSDLGAGNFEDTGHVGADGSASLDRHVAVRGSVTVGGGLDVSHSVYVTGSVTVGGELSGSVNAPSVSVNAGSVSPCRDSYDLSAALGAASQDNNNELLAPASFVDGGLDIPRGGKVTLASGDYYLAYLQVGANAELTVEAGGEVRLFVDGPVVLGRQQQVGGSPASVGDKSLPWAGWERLTILTSTTQPISAAAGTRIHAHIYAPNAATELGRGVFVAGAITAATIRHGGHGQIQHVTR